MNRAEVTAQVLDAKRRLGLTGKALAAELGCGFSGFLHGGPFRAPRVECRRSEESRRAVKAGRRGGKDVGRGAGRARSEPKDATQRSTDLSLLRIGPKVWPNLEGLDQ